MAATGNRWQSQAARDAALKFAPQHRSLMEALMAARDTYGQTVRAGNSTAKLTEQAASRALPSIQQIYGKADSAQQAGVTLVNQQLAGLGEGANQYKANEASEVQQQLANLLGARSRDEGILTTAGTQARAGAQFNQSNARQVLQQTIRGILSKGAALGEEQGLTAQTEAEKLAHEAEDAERSERQSERTANTSRANSRESNATSRANSREHAHGGSSAPGGVKQLTTKEQNEGSNTLSELRPLVDASARAGHSRGQTISLLSKAEPSIKSEGITIPGRKAYVPNVLMSAALDEAETGHVSRVTLQRLHAAGYSIRQLGLHPPPSSQQIQQSQNRGAGHRRTA